MLILNENNKPLILDSIHTPTLTEYMYVLDLEMMDFTLTPLTVLEEIIAPTIELTVHNFTFTLPANWNVLVVDDETLQLDVVEVSELSGRDFHAFVYGPDKPRHEQVPLQVTDYSPHFTNVGPSLTKNQMLCHPIAPNAWINVSPSDTYNKYLKGCVVGNII